MGTAFLISDLHINYYLGSNPSKQSISELLSGHLVPADVLIVAGDIADYSKAVKKTISYLSDVYETVFWVNGNHEMISHSGESSYMKVGKFRTHLIAPNAHYLDGNVVSHSNSLIGGAMGYCDFSYAKKHFNVSDEYMETQWKMTSFDGRVWNIGLNNALDVWQDEYGKLSDCVEAQCNVMVSHFGPYPLSIRPEFHNIKTGFYYFDGYGLMQRMPPNSVWCFGHTHDYYKETIDNVTLMCNPFGFTDETRNTPIPKEEFVFEI